MTDFDLDALINETIEATGLIDPVELAAAISIPSHQWEQALRLVLPSYVSDHLRKSRQAAFNREFSPEPGSRRTGASRWAKFTPEILNSSVTVAGERKMLGDCTVDDLETVAADYIKKADQMVGWAERYKDLAKRLRLSGAATLREAEATAVGPVLIEAAAA